MQPFVLVSRLNLRLNNFLEYVYATQNKKFKFLPIILFLYYHAFPCYCTESYNLNLSGISRIPEFHLSKMIEFSTQESCSLMISNDSGFFDDLDSQMNKRDSDVVCIIKKCLKTDFISKKFMNNTLNIKKHNESIFQYCRKNKLLGLNNISSDFTHQKSLLSFKKIKNDDQHSFKPLIIQNNQNRDKSEDVEILSSDKTITNSESSSFYDTISQPISSYSAEQSEFYNQIDYSSTTNYAESSNSFTYIKPHQKKVQKIRYWFPLKNENNLKEMQFDIFHLSRLEILDRNNEFKGMNYCEKYRFKKNKNAENIKNFNSMSFQYILRVYENIYSIKKDINILMLKMRINEELKIYNTKKLDVKDFLTDYNEDYFTKKMNLYLKTILIAIKMQYRCGMIEIVNKFIYYFYKSRQGDMSVMVFFHNKIIENKIVNICSGIFNRFHVMLVKNNKKTDLYYTLANRLKKMLKKRDIILLYSEEKMMFYTILTFFTEFTKTMNEWLILTKIILDHGDCNILFIIFYLYYENIKFFKIPIYEGSIFYVILNQCAYRKISLDEFESCMNPIRNGTLKRNKDTNVIYSKIVFSDNQEYQKRNNIFKFWKWKIAAESGEVKMKKQKVSDFFESVCSVFLYE